MGFKVKIEGAETIDLSIESVETVKFSTDTPKDTNARSKDVGTTMVITGKILTAVDGDPFDSTRKIGTWSLVPAEKADCYRKVTVDVISADQVIRKITYPNAFVVDYREHYGDTEGIGTFELIVRQKKDKLNMVTIEGGYSA
ncbi:membrane-associated protease 1 [Clostridium butyricum]|uniref:membrane-associated protease 1 n=1 Tax=Clostridium butyricum TaxID=1492 RepID=UPI001CA815DD|nr:membrane-associated protease 1 [Clostridium butyricum]MBZ0314282.1 membrane-associated protease 1 [Clostridium butyricum]